EQPTQRREVGERGLHAVEDERVEADHRHLPSGGLRHAGSTVPAGPRWRRWEAREKAPRKDAVAARTALPERPERGPGRPAREQRAPQRVSALARGFFQSAAGDRA